MVAEEPSPRIPDSRPNDLRETCEEMETRRRELIATNESTVVAKSIFNTLVMEDGECN